MDFLRAHHDGQLIGANTLREEPGPDGLGWDYDIDDGELRRYREGTLRFGKQKILVLTGTGKIDLTHRIFNSARVEPWIVTAAEGEQYPRSQLRAFGRDGTIRIVSVGGNTRVDLVSAIQRLRQEHGIRTLLPRTAKHLRDMQVQGSKFPRFPAIRRDGRQRLC